MHRRCDRNKLLIESLIAAQVCQRVPVEDAEKGRERLLQGSAEMTDRRNDTAIVLAIKTFYQEKILLSLSYHLPNTYSSGIARKPHATLATAHRFNVAELAQLMHNLHQVIAGDGVGVSNILDVYSLGIRRGRQIE